MYLMHRDLKPGNILVDDKDGIRSLKICDLGFSRHWPDDPEVQERWQNEFEKHRGTRPRSLSHGVQTLFWRAPEVCEYWQEVAKKGSAKRIRKTQRKPTTFIV